MTRFYVCAIACVALVGVFFWGRQMGRAKCMIDAATMQNQSIIKSINIQRDVYEKTGNIGVRDIRDGLRKKYTIGQ